MRTSSSSRTGHDAHVMRLPSLGPRGEGWVLAQALVLGSVAVAGRFGRGRVASLGAVGRVLGIGTLLAGAVLMVRGARELGSSLTPLPRPADHGTLVHTGIYRSVRHPIYGGLIVGAAGWALATASAAALALLPATTAFFWLKSRREEAWLRDRYPGYDAYRAGTRRFVPHLW